MQIQGDVQLFQSVDGGEITVTDGIVVLSSGLDTAVYLSLWGGNEDCTARPGCMFTWWGDLEETDEAYRHPSLTQYLLKTIPAVPANLRRIEDAITSDLKWMVEKNIASEIDAHNVTIPAPNHIKIVVKIIAQGLETNFEYVENWKAGE